MAESIPEKSLLRLTTTGSVDDGKSTLIGRLLYETRSIYDDQYQALQKTALQRGTSQPDLALLLDGLAAEREQGITIDVAYRYFETAKRKFIIADCPGHEQYTRNMVTGASQSELAIILIDASKGLQTQSRRHGFLLSLLQVRHLIVAVNKMDGVDYAESVYLQIIADFAKFCAKLDIQDIEYIPVSALKGDNLTRRSPQMPWYQGPTLLHKLEHVEIAADANHIDFRFPVQSVIRPDNSFRGYAGQVASGSIRVGENVCVLPTGHSTQIASIQSFDGQQSSANVGEAVVISLNDHFDIARGDMLVRPQNQPHQSKELEAMLCWMHEVPLEQGQFYWLKQTTRTVKAWVTRLHYQVDVNTLHRQTNQILSINGIGRVEIQTAQPLYFDTYRQNRSTGSFILIDPESRQTVAAGMIRTPSRGSQAKEPTQEIEQALSLQINAAAISLQQRAARNGHPAGVIWLTGLSGAGKSTLANSLAQLLFANQHHIMQLDGDHLRQGLCQDLGFSAADRHENNRRAAELARLFYQQGNLVICSLISPYAADRQAIRQLFPDGRFLEVYLNCPVSTCQQRDPKGLYAKVARGEISGFTGIDAPYEAPTQPDLELNTEQLSLAESLTKLLAFMKSQDWLIPDSIQHSNA